jgi:hypothetical protein
MRFLYCLPVGSLLISTVLAQAVSDPPPVAIPSIQEVQQWSKDKKTVSLVATHVEQVPTTKVAYEMVTENGVTKFVARFVKEPVTRKVVSKYALQDIRASDVGGKVLTPEEVFKRLPAGSVVLVVPESHQIPDSLRHLLSKDAVIFTILGQKASKPAAAES